MMMEKITSTKTMWKLHHGKTSHPWQKPVQWYATIQARGTALHDVYFRVSFSLPVTVFTLTVALCMGPIHRPLFAIHAGVLLE